jgi:hypothetical protein
MPANMPNAALDSQLKDLLVSNNFDDAVTTRERLRNQRRGEMRSKYEDTLGSRLARDTSRAVVCNVNHQQQDVAPSTPGHPLVESLMKGAYYGAKEPIPEIERPHGLGRRVTSSKTHAPAAPQPVSAEKLREAERREEARQRAILEAAKRVHKHVYMVKPFPQDDSHDYWGRPISRAQRASRAHVNERTFEQLVGIAPPPPPTGHVAPGPIPGFDMAGADVNHEPCQTPADWQKPLVTDPKRAPNNHPPAPTPLVTRQVQVATKELQAAAGTPRAGSSLARRDVDFIGRPRSASAGYGPSRQPARGVLPAAPQVVQPESATMQRFMHRPHDTMISLF